MENKGLEEVCVSISTEGNFLRDLQGYYKDSGIVFVGRIFSIFMSLAFSIKLARVYSPQEFGLLQLILSTGLLVGGILSGGAQKSVTHFIAKVAALGRIREIYQVIYFASILTAILTVIGMGILMIVPNALLDNLISPEYRNVSIVITVGTLSALVPYYIILGAALRGLKKFGFFHFWDGVLRPFLFILPLFFLKPNEFIWVFPATFLVLICIAIIYIGNTIKIQNRSENSQNSSDIELVYTPKEYLAFAMPLGLSAIFSQASGDFHTVLLGMLSDEAQVSYFKIAMSLGGSLQMILVGFASPFFPLASQYVAAKRKRELIELYRKIIKWIWLLTIPVGTLLIVYSDTIIRLLYGNEYIPGKGVVQLVIAGFCVNVMFGLINTVVLSFGKTLLKLQLEFGIFVFAVATHINLTPLWGARSAGLVILLSFIIYNLISYIYMSRNQGFRKIFDASYWVYLATICTVVYTVQNQIESIVHNNEILELILASLLVAFVVLIVFLKNSKFEEERDLFIRIAKRPIRKFL